MIRGIVAPAQVFMLYGCIFCNVFVFSRLSCTYHERLDIDNRSGRGHGEYMLISQRGSNDHWIVFLWISGVCNYVENIHTASCTFVMTFGGLKHKNVIKMTDKHDTMKKKCH